MRRNGRVDSNQREITLALRKLGASVLVTSNLHNCFDLLVGYRGVNYIFEVKDPTQPPSKRKLTEGEEKFRDSWKGGTYYVIETIEQAIEILNTNK